jgi:hypothetical protein
MALSILSLVLGGLGLSVLGYQPSNNNGVFSRRNILATAASVAATTLVATPRSVLAAADQEDPLVSVYFGVGVSLSSKNLVVESFPFFFYKKYILISRGY